MSLTLTRPTIPPCPLTGGVRVSHISSNGTMWLWIDEQRRYEIVGYTKDHPVYGMDEGL